MRHGCCAATSCLVDWMRMGRLAPYVGRYHYGRMCVDGTLQIRYRRAELDPEALRTHGTVIAFLASDDAKMITGVMITGVRIAQPGTAIPWRR